MRGKFDPLVWEVAWKSALLAILALAIGALAGYAITNPPGLY